MINGGFCDFYTFLALYFVIFTHFRHSQGALAVHL